MSDNPEIIQLFSAQVCPYAHRTRLVLAEKGADFTLSEIDLKNKPQEFLDVSRYGKVPTLAHRGHALVESTIINQEPEDSLPQPPMTPRDPSLTPTHAYLDRLFR